MPRITWNSDGTRRYETGVDRGVLFASGERPAPWNGLVSLQESNADSTVTPFYVDGIKYLNRVTPGEYVATLQAYTYPEEFEVCDGTLELANGFTISEQDRKPFDLSYRTRIGNDLVGPDFGYKLHLLFGAYAAPSAGNYASIGDGVTPQTFSWGLTTLPIHIPGFLPSSHFTLNSTRAHPTVMNQVESILYGNSSESPRMPTIPEILAIFASSDTTANTFSEFFEARF